MVDVEWGSLTSLFFVLSFLLAACFLCSFSPLRGGGGDPEISSIYFRSLLAPSLSSRIFFCSANNMQSLYEHNSSAHAALLHWNIMQKIILERSSL